MQLYASKMPPNSAQARRLANAIDPWPHGRHATASIRLFENPQVQEARKTMIATVRTVLQIYNKYEAFGQENLEIPPPFIIAANHASHIDTAAIFAAMPLRLIPLVHPVAASDLFFRNRLAAELSANIVNAVPFDRFGEFEKSMAECRRLLAEKQILIIFPEGTRSTTGKVGPFRSGASQLAIDAGCPVIPAFIEGSGEVLGKQKYVYRPGKLRITFGTPIQPPREKADLRQIQHFTKQLQHAVIDLGDFD
jgi:1-acyl-sn-glycerol-3-phosphate acyltransferase